MGKNKRIAILSSLVSMLIPIVLTVFFFACKENLPDVPPQEVDEEEIIVPFAQVPSLSEMIIYEVNPLAFSADGSIAELTNRLGHFKELGVNVLWLMPIYPEGEINGVGSPYCVQDYTNVNPNYGTVEDLSDFVKGAHAKGMAVILDWVANHTSWDNEWISNTDWYVKDANGNIIIPPGTNWQDVAELNYNNQEMRLEMIKAMKFWIETCNIDGFRFDAVEFVPQSFWVQAIDSLKSMEGRNLILLAESGKKENLSAGFQMIYGWDYQPRMKEIFQNKQKASAITATHKMEYANMPAGTHRLRYITNHDICGWEESPVTSFQSAKGSVTAFVVTVFMGGVPMIYTGQEVGHPNTISFFNPNPINWSINPEILKTYQKVLAVRKAQSPLISGELKAYDTENVVSFTHTKGDETLWVMANVRATESSYPIPDEFKNSTWKNALDSTDVAFGSSIVLDPFEFLIVKK
jgi:glycosidase